MTLELHEATERKVCARMIKAFGEENQKFVAIEELSELQKEVCKDLRGEANEYSLAEEIADSLIVIAQLMMMYDIDSKVDMFVDYKFDRMREKLRGVEEPEW